MKEKQMEALGRIKAIVDAYMQNTIHITAGCDDFNKETHTYDVSVIMGIINNYISDVQRDDENIMKGEQFYEYH